MSRLIVSKISKKFGSRKVVKDISLTVAQNEIVGLLGPNGAGKTTCFYMITGLIPTKQGEISLNNNNITRLNMRKRSALGLSYLPQEKSIFRKMNVEENIISILELQPQLKRIERKEILEKLLKEFNISHLRKSPAPSLSGGECRRVEIARALATNPKFILLDEPFAGIDPISISDIKKMILKLKQRGIGVLITDHNVRETLKICDRAYVVHDGKILIEGTAEEVVQHTKVKNVYLGDEFEI
jgi:lipopolysaccharide export system ATP-binding protein